MAVLALKSIMNIMTRHNPGCVPTFMPRSSYSVVPNMHLGTLAINRRFQLTHDLKLSPLLSNAL